MSGDVGSSSGSNKSINHSSGGGNTLIKKITKSFSTSYTSALTKSVSGSISGITVVGTTMSHSGSFTIPKRPASAPSTPTSPLATSITAAGATFSWTAPANNGAALTQYNLQISTNSGFTSLVVNETAAWTTSRVISTLAKATTYYWRVRAINSAGNGSYTAGSSFKTSSTAPNAPTITSGSVTATGAMITIQPGANGGSAITSHSVQYATNASFTGATTVTTTTSTRALTSLVRSTTYYVRALSTNAIGPSANSAVINFTTLKTPPSVPGAPTVSSITHNSANVTSTPPVDNGGAAIASYTVQVATNSGFTTGVQTFTGVTSFPYTATGLPSNTPMWVRVLAINSMGSSPYTAGVAFTTASGVPSAPLSPTIMTVTATSIELAWSPPASTGGSAVTGYVVETTPGTSHPDVESPYEVEELTYNTAHTIKVAATNANGTGPFTTPLAFNTLTRTPLGAAAPTISAITGNGAQVTAAAPSQDGGSTILGYVFQVSEDETFEDEDLLRETVTEGIGSTVITQLGLDPGTEYFARTAAINAHGVGDWSEVKDFETLPGYTGRLRVVINPTGKGAPAMRGALNTNVKLDHDPAIPVVSTDVAFTVPNPLRGAATVDVEIDAEHDFDIGLSGYAYIARKLKVNAGLTGVINHEAKHKVTVYLADITVPVLTSTPMFNVGLVGTVTKQPYGDGLWEPELTAIGPGAVSLDPVSEEATLDIVGAAMDNPSGLPSTLTLEPVDGRTDI